MEKENINVYLATLPRSGSTLLGMMLDSHPEVFHMGESSYWGKLNPKEVVCSCGPKGCPILLEIYGRVSGKNTVESIYRACSMIDRIEEPNKQYHSLSLPDSRQKESPSPEKLESLLLLSCFGLETLSDEFRRITGKRIIVDNTKAIRIAEKLVKRSNWKVIILLRDPRGMAYSNKKSGQRKGVLRPISSKIPVYKDFSRRALRLLNGQFSVHYVKYEEICHNPLNSIREVCDFLGVEYAPAMLNFKKDKGHTLMGNRMRFDSNQLIKEDLEWKMGLNQREIATLEKDSELVSLFGQLGYEICD